MMEKEEIRYCLWKGSQLLAESLSGHSDLDLMVDEFQAAQFEQILLDLGYKRFISQPWSNFPGIEDWIGFDWQIGFSKSKVIDIDASRPVEEVLSAVKQGVWESI